MNFGHFFGLTVGICLGLAGNGLAAAAQPAAVAESELFEVVGRLGEEGMILYVDRSETNAPVLGAVLEVESGGRAAKAVFRPATGDYLLADAAWLAPLRQPGGHPLAITVLAGDDSDLLSAELDVSPEAAAPAAGPVDGRLGGALAALLAVGAGVWWRRRKGAQP